MSGLHPESLEQTQARLAGQGTVVPPIAAPPRPARRGAALAAGLLVVLALVGVAVAVYFFTAAPATDPDAWRDYPGTAYRDQAEVLAGDSMESATAAGEAFVAELQDELTARYELSWTETYPAVLEHDVNGYGGASMLYNYDSGSWHGSAIVTGAAARAGIEGLFIAAATAHGADDVYTLNDLYDDEPVAAKQSWGAEHKPDQALWSLVATDSSANLTFIVDVFDATLPTDSSFEGDLRFDVASGGQLYVRVQATAYGLLAEQDREAFLDALEPFEGQEPPEITF